MTTSAPSNGTTSSAPTVDAPDQHGPWVLLGVFVAITAALLAVPLGLLLGLLGVLLAVVLAAAAGWWAYASADGAVLRLSRAEPADPVTYARLHNVVEGLCMANGLAKPSVYIVVDEAPNALVVGRDPKRAAIVATTGLLDALDRIELEAVVAHLVTYLRSDEIGVSTLAVTTVGLLTLVADRCIQAATWNGGREGHPEDRTTGQRPFLGPIGRALLTLAPLLARLLRFGIGPDRHAVADLSAVVLTRYPPGLIAALEKLPEGTTVVHSGARSTAHLWIAAPIARTESEGALAATNARFDSHPAIDVRIATLREL